MADAARREAVAREGLLRLAQKEHEDNLRERGEYNRIHAWSLKFDEIKNASSLWQRLSLISEMQMEADSFDLNIVSDIAYKDRFYKTQNKLKSALVDLYKECGSNAIYFKAANIVLSGKGVTSLSDVKLAEQLAELKNIPPDISSKLMDRFQHDASDFFSRAITFKSVYEALKTHIPPSCNVFLKDKLAKETNIPSSVVLEKEYDSLETLPLSEKNYFWVNNVVLSELIVDESISAGVLQPFCDFVTNKCGVERIDVKEFRSHAKFAKTLKKGAPAFGCLGSFLCLIGIGGVFGGNDSSMIVPLIFGIAIIILALIFSKNRD